jgi:transketolase
MNIPNNLEEISKKYRRELFEKFLEVGQGHPGSVFSMLEIIVTLYYKNFIRFDPDLKKFKDKIIISKGHAAVALYPVLRDFGVMPEKEWENWGKGKESILRVFGNTSMPGINATSGSLGHGLGIACGMAYAYKKNNIDQKVYTIISEGELYEGSTWEAFLFASHHNLTNLNIVIDENSLIILGKTDDCIKLSPIKKKLEGFDFLVHECDGHNIMQLEKAFADVTGKTKVILAKTIKGKGFSIMENKAHWHYWNKLSDSEIQICRKEVE